MNRTHWIWIALSVGALACGGGESGGGEEGSASGAESGAEDASLEETGADVDPTTGGEPDVDETSGEETGGIVCPTGEVIGGTCDPLTPEGAACTSVVVDTQDCSGNAVTLESTLLVGGGFTLQGVPTGVQTVTVQVGAVSAECKVPVQADQKAFIGANECTCEPEDCGALFSAECFDALVVDGCNCKDDDCDGLVDEDCLDTCNCQDDDCDGVVDEDCVDDCDGIDADCDGVTDEDCPYVNDCTNPAIPFDDCDDNDVPDQCPVCPPLEVVFIIDTSGSMGDELEALCAGIESTIATLGVVNIETSAELLGITQVLQCTHETVLENYGTIAAGAPPDLPAMTACQNATESSEDWGPAIAVVAANKDWSPGALRVIVPVSDEGPVCGTPVDAEDFHVVDPVAKIALANDVVVYPITGTNTPADVIQIAQELAEKTGGIWKATSDPASDLAGLVLESVFDACESVSDCNANGIPDSCDLAEGAIDCNANEIPDECDVAVGGLPDCDVNGIPDSCDLDGGAPDCNENGALDPCDIAEELSADADENGVPDECEEPPGETGGETGEESGSDEDGEAPEDSGETA
jgi:hypothetical protein